MFPKRNYLTCCFAQSSDWRILTAPPTKYHAPNYILLTFWLSPEKQKALWRFSETENILTSQLISQERAFAKRKNWMFSETIRPPMWGVYVFGPQKLWLFRIKTSQPPHSNIFLSSSLVCFTCEAWKIIKHFGFSLEKGRGEVNYDAIQLKTEQSFCSF